MVEQSLAASFQPFGYANAELAWSEVWLVVRPVDDVTRPATRDGYVHELDAQVDDHVVPFAAMKSLHVVHPWPAVEIVWHAAGVDRRLLAHPRGLSRLVPASDGARTAFEHFESCVVALVDEVSRKHAHVHVERGWVDDEIVSWTRRDLLPSAQKRDGSYRDAIVTDALLARAQVERPLLTRMRVGLWRRFGDRSAPFPVELAVSEREVWIVDDVGAVWGVPRRALRGIYADENRIACVFGRSTFLAMSIAHSPIRQTLVEVAERIVTQNEALRDAR